MLVINKLEMFVYKSRTMRQLHRIYLVCFTYISRFVRFIKKFVLSKDNMLKLITECIWGNECLVRLNYFHSDTKNWLNKEMNVIIVILMLRELLILSYRVKYAIWMCVHWASLSLILQKKSYIRMMDTILVTFIC